MTIPLSAEGDQGKVDSNMQTSGLVNGPYGDWLLKTYTTRNTSRTEWNHLIEEIYTVTIAFNQARYFDYSLGYGLTGFLWTLKILGVINPDVNKIVDLETLLPLIESECLRMIRARNYDLFQGAYGLMMYLIETQCLSGQIYDGYVHSLQENLDDSGQLIPSSTALGRHNTPFRGVNLGIPHGVAGCILMLLRLYEVQPREHCQKIIKEAVDFLLRKARKSGSDDIRFPYSDHGDSEFPPLAWCYGDLCSGYTLLKAGVVIHDSITIAEGIRILDATLERTDFVKGDLSMCHGPPCIAYLYWKAFHLSGSEKYLKRSEYWKIECKRVLEELNGEKRKEFISNPGLIYGYPGMKMALQTLNGEITQEWDSWMLI